MKTSIATVTLSNMTPYSQSRAHEEPRLEGEMPNDYDKRTWRSKLTTRIVGDDGHATVVVPAHAIHQCVISAAKYSKRQIPGQGKATWTAKFTSGITLFGDIDLGIDPESVGFIDIYANADGIRGSGKRVMRRFPIINDWKATFDVCILDPIITKDIFAEMIETAGLLIGIGRFRPEKGGTNGRFSLDRLDWQDKRETIKRAA